MAPQKPARAPEPAPTTSATVTTAPAGVQQANRLDTILVLGTLVIVAGSLWGLFGADLKLTLPIIAGTLGTLIGTVIGGYAGYRWGASDALKKLTATTTTAA